MTQKTTVSTCKRFLASVIKHVSGKASTRSRTIGTDITRKWFLASTSKNVSGKRYLIITPIVTKSTCLIIGDSAQENSLLRWCKKYNYNALSLYDTKAILLNRASYPMLAAFIKKARTQYKIKSVGAVRSLGIQFTGSTSTYNKARKDTSEKFNVFNLENEWWNNGPSCDFSCYQSHLITMNNAAHAANPKIKSEEFFGWFLNPAGNEIGQATAGRPVLQSAGPLARRA